MTISTLPVHHNPILLKSSGIQEPILVSPVEQEFMKNKAIASTPICRLDKQMPGACNLPNSPYAPTGLASHHSNNPVNLSVKPRNEFYSQRSNSAVNLSAKSGAGLYSMPNHSSPNMHSQLEASMPHSAMQQLAPSLPLAPHSTLAPPPPSVGPTIARHHHSLSLSHSTSSQFYNNSQPMFSGKHQGYHYRQASQPPHMAHYSKPHPHINGSGQPSYSYHQNSNMLGLHASGQANGASSMIDNNHLLDSSLLAANMAGRKNARNQPILITHQNLAIFRNDATSSNDPRKLLEFAKLLLEADQVLPHQELDTKKARKVHDELMREAQRIVKKLASHSVLGKQAYADAQFFLANCYGTGAMDLPTDTEKAFSFYVQGSKQNHPGCTYRTGVCYEVGAGTKRDKDHAMQFYRKAANLGDQAAMYKLGVILLKGFLGQPKSPREGISWLRRAAQLADEDHPHALHELGLAFEKEGIPSILPDLNYARELFTQAAQYGYAPSQFKLGLAYENGFLNCPVDPRRSIAWYSKAAQQGDIEAEFALSGWYLTGAEGILQQSDREAYLWARKAADKGNPKAEYAVGYFAETGTGTSQNLEEARRWYMRASAQNYVRATQRLTELKYNGTVPRQREVHSRENNTSSNVKDSECIVM